MGNPATATAQDGSVRAGEPRTGLLFAPPIPARNGDRPAPNGRWADPDGPLRRLRGDHTPRKLAGSVALETFVTILPTLGTGVLLFVLLVAVTERVSQLALFASVVVFKPVVKGASTPRASRSAPSYSVPSRG